MKKKKAIKTVKLIEPLKVKQLSTIKGGATKGIVVDDIAGF